jgi:hypothetical protein
MAMNAPEPVIAAMSHSLAGIGGGADDMMGSDVWSPKIEGKTGGGNSQAPEELSGGQRCAAIQPADSLGSCIAWTSGMNGLGVSMT